MIKIDSRSAVSPSEQIKSGFRDLVARSLLKPGEEVPTVSTLAQSLLLNPNVVTRAYQELIKEGFLEANPGKPPVIASSSHHQAALDRGDLIQKFFLAVQQLREAGIEWPELDSAIELQKRQEKTTGGSVVLSSKSICPYCRSRIVDEAETVSCMLCKTIHHNECWNESGHCSVFGCKGKVKLVL